jgi:hypothetical protein
MSSETAPETDTGKKAPVGQQKAGEADAGTTEKGAVSARATPWLKEGVASVLALAIAAVALVLLVLTFISAKNNGTGAVAAFGRQKDVLQFILPILGTVIGYYFGRVPAERRAEVAEQSASGSQKQAESAQQTAARADAERTAVQFREQQVRTDAKDTMARVRTALAGTSRPTLGAQVTAQPDVTRAMAELDAFDARLS